MRLYAPPLDIQFLGSSLVAAIIVLVLGKYLDSSNKGIRFTNTWVMGICLVVWVLSFVSYWNAEFTDHERLTSAALAALPLFCIASAMASIGAAILSKYSPTSPFLAGAGAGFIFGGPMMGAIYLSFCDVPLFIEDGDWKELVVTASGVCGALSGAYAGAFINVWRVLSAELRAPQVKSYIGFSSLCCLFASPWTGIPAILNSRAVIECLQAGDLEGAEYSSKRALRWCIYSVILMVAIPIGVIATHAFVNS